MFGIGPMELGIVAVILMLIFGPAQIPRLGKAMGQTIREFRGVGKELRSLHEDEDDAA